MTKEYLICLLGFIENFFERHTVARAEQPLRQRENWRELGTAGAGTPWGPALTWCSPGASGSESGHVGLWHCSSGGWGFLASVGKDQGCREPWRERTAVHISGLSAEKPIECIFLRKREIQAQGATA